MVTVDVDEELAHIIKEMKASPMVDKAIRNYARAFIDDDDESWDKKYKKSY